MDKHDETISRDQFFADVMQGFAEASQFARGQTPLRVTYVEIEAAEPAVTKVKVDTAVEGHVQTPG